MSIKFEVNMQQPIISILCLLPERLERVFDIIRRERRFAKDAHDFKDESSNFEVILDEGNEAICDDGNANLYADSVLGLSLEAFDLKALLESGEVKVVSVKHRVCQRLVRGPVHGVDIMYFGIGGCYICKFPKVSTAYKLVEHKNHQMIPMRHVPALGSVVVLGEYTPELPLNEELCYLCKNEIRNMHIRSDLVLDAKVKISNPGQSVRRLKCCSSELYFLSLNYFQRH